MTKESEWNLNTPSEHCSGCSSNEHKHEGNWVIKTLFNLIDFILFQLICSFHKFKFEKKIAVKDR